MVGKRISLPRKGKGKEIPSRHPVAAPYREMLAEALPLQTDVSQRSLKRRKTGRREPTSAVSAPKSSDFEKDDDDDDEMEFEDVDMVTPNGDRENTDPFKQLQTAYRDTDDESDEEDQEWEAVDFDALPQEDEPKGALELNLNRVETPQKGQNPTRKRAINKEERKLRLHVHKMHVLCLLSFVQTRNEWCNDYQVQKLLKPLLTRKMMTFLQPDPKLPVFGRTNSLKRGLEDVGVMWRKRFNITELGMRRSLWANNEKDVQKHHPFPGEDSCLEKSDFLKAAKELKGSRDVGAQLYVALLRSAGVESRLVCSLQPLSFTGGGPAMIFYVPKNKTRRGLGKEDANEDEFQMDALNYKFANPGDYTPDAGPSRRRLGHPGATNYAMPDISAPIRLSGSERNPDLSDQESHYPVFWIEVMDEAHRKWLPVDPLVTQTIAKPRAFEPSLQDPRNNMVYVVAFEEDGYARDVTKRYTKGFNAKTRRIRVESTPGGERWWRRTMGSFSRGWIGKTEFDEAEDLDLATYEAQEPMPKNIVDFKDHPVFALERHLKKNQVLVGMREVGKVAAGRDLASPGQKKLESVFRRRDVKTVKSADAWYRVGRDVKMGEQPVKTVPAKGRPDEDDEDAIDERPGTNLYTEDQTELYDPPPIVNGHVPKNSYGNLDIYVPTMVPKGGVHIRSDETSRAARLLGIDYSDALTGFQFRGRHGTAILQGAVVASEYSEAVAAVIDGFRDERARDEEERRSLQALRMWKRFLAGLRVKERVDAYASEDEDVENGEDGEEDEEFEDDGKGMESEEYNDEDFEGGGFFPE